MKEVISPLLHISAERKNWFRTRRQSRKQTLWIFALIAGAAGSVFAFLTGLIISGLVSLDLLANPKAASQIGTLLIIAAFPLMLLSAHALDRIRAIERDKKSKLQNK